MWDTARISCATTLMILLSHLRRPGYMTAGECGAQFLACEYRSLVLFQAIGCLLTVFWDWSTGCIQRFFATSLFAHFSRLHCLVDSDPNERCKLHWLG